MSYELIIRRSFGVDRNDIIPLGAQTFFERLEIAIPMLEIALKYAVLRFRDNDELLSIINEKLHELLSTESDFDARSLSAFCESVIDVYNEFGI